MAEELFQTEVSGDVKAVSSMDEQLLFASALALTKTGQAGQQASIDAILKFFTVRSTWYQPSSPFGVRFRPATKANLETDVESAAPWLQLHETGGIKTPRGRMLAIPTRFVRPDARALIPASRRPRNIRNPVVIRSRSGSLILAERQGERLIPLYVLTPRARIRRESVVIDPVTDTFNREFPANFSRSLEKALETAK
jgi:hypothetical protein